MSTPKTLLDMICTEALIEDVGVHICQDCNCVMVDVNEGCSFCGSQNVVWMPSFEGEPTITG